MTSRARRKYFNLAMDCSIPFLQVCIANPTRYQQPMHIALLRIALRRKIDF